MTPLFLDAKTAAAAADSLTHVRSLVRRAKRWTTKAESLAGQAAHRALHEAETTIDKTIALLGGRA